jgi:AcrR family transcriptional regulator
LISKRQQTREHIMTATVACIEKYGIQGLTIRNIAEQANLNSAAINYYFGSKQELLKATFEFTWGNAIEDWDEIVNRKDTDTYTVLFDFFMFTIEGVYRYPNLSKAYFYEPIISGNYKGYVVMEFIGLLRRLRDKIRTLNPDMAYEDIDRSLMQMTSSIFLLVLMPGIFKDFSAIDLHDPAQRKAYINHLIKRFFG